MLKKRLSTLFPLSLLLLILTGCIMPLKKMTFCDFKEKGFDKVVQSSHLYFWDNAPEPGRSYTTEDDPYERKFVEGLVIRRINAKGEPDAFAGYHPDCDSDKNGQPDIFLAVALRKYRRVNRITSNEGPGRGLIIDGVPLDDAHFLYKWYRGQIDLERLKKMIDRGVNVNLPRASNKSLLLIAAERGNHAAVDFLLEHGADTRYRTKEDYSFFMALAAGGLDDHVKKLIADGADVNQRMNTTNETPLIFAVETGNRKIARSLIEAGADVTASKTSHTFVDRYNFKLYTKPMMKRIHNSASEVADNTKYNEAADTPLMMAARDGDLEMMKLLFDACKQQAKESEAAPGGCVDTANRWGESALFVAARFGQDEASFWLIDHGADTKGEMDWGKTLLDNAAIGGAEGLTRHLLDEGVRMSGPPERKSALEYAIQSGHVKVVAMLLDKNMWDDKTRATLSVARLASNSCTYSQPAILRLFPEKALASCAKSILWRGMRWPSNVELVKLGLELGADVNEAEMYGNTPLMIAVRNGNIEIIKVILINKPKIGHKNNDGKTALSIARKWRHSEIATLIEEAMTQRKE